ncbi:hypothetical protein Bca52824_006629 [Brassica carinata]|uniref:F-box domain-containing protein n=1 Tax=Brassica carinata TaxID=52824 RepID=A0A8X7W5E8_BRACI|nr:hypothetical protein Bca52824_006629 [Brassica carinata]
MNTQNNLSLLESLPQDLFGEILSRVASSSVEDIRQCLTVSKKNSSAVQDHCVFKKLNIRPQAMNPLVMFFRFHHRMEKSTNSHNPAAHYIEGIKQYFIFDKGALGYST